MLHRPRRTPPTTDGVPAQHARRRQQFGRPIGALQPSRHHCPHGFVRAGTARAAGCASAVSTAPRAVAAAAGSRRRTPAARRRHRPAPQPRPFPTDRGQGPHLRVRGAGTTDQGAEAGSPRQPTPRRVMVFRGCSADRRRCTAAGLRCDPGGPATDVTDRERRAITERFRPAGRRTALVTSRSHRPAPVPCVGCEWFRGRAVPVLPKRRLRIRRCAPLLARSGGLCCPPVRLPATSVAQYAARVLLRAGICPKRLLR
jgi:hypothetical protein